MFRQPSGGPKGFLLADCLAELERGRLRARTGVSCTIGRMAVCEFFKADELVTSLWRWKTLFTTVDLSGKQMALLLLRACRGWQHSIQPQVARELRVVVFQVVSQFDQRSRSRHLSAAEKFHRVAQFRIL